MLLTLGSCHRRGGTATGEYALPCSGRRPGDLFRRLEQHLRETGSAIPTAPVNAGRPWTVGHQPVKIP
jgi:hypothetical protein